MPPPPLTWGTAYFHHHHHCQNCHKPPLWPSLSSPSPLLYQSHKSSWWWGHVSVEAVIRVVIYHAPVYVSNNIHMCACACAGWKIHDLKYHVAYSVGFHSLTVTICQKKNRATKTLQICMSIESQALSQDSKKNHSLKFWSLMISFCPKVKQHFKERCLLWQSPTFIVWSCYVNCGSWVSPLFVITASIRLKPDFFNIWDFSTPHASHCD